MAPVQGGYVDIPLTPVMARLMTASLNGSASLWIAGGVAIGLGDMVAAGTFAFGTASISLPTFFTLSGDNAGTLIVLGLVGLIAAALIFAGLWRIHLGRVDVRAGIAKRFYGLVLIGRKRTVGGAGISRTTYSIDMPGVVLVRTRAEVAEPLFAKHVQIRSALDPLSMALAGTDEAHVSFTGWVEFAPVSQFVFRVIDEG